MPNILAIAQYERAGAADGDEHWCLVAVSTAGQTTQTFEIIGGTHDYAYSTKEVKILRSTSLCGGCAVGEFQEDGIQWLTTRLSEVPITHNNGEWNCRNWVVDAVRELQLDQRERPAEARVKINPEFSQRAILAELKEERESAKRATTISSRDY
ncbi:hypothetical protein BDV98DRAFT_440522 [Pterulicium gracile]|uniref:Uncharacterized protein n=1 Tax=Pterulicium gracile TaxID=1884261 RepID=A0A5C3Q4R8_9AGAR|nr:hypothetical protein BDV98DRAFT_440522 [Pterula gracilis]